MTRPTGVVRIPRDSARVPVPGTNQFFSIVRSYRNGRIDVYSVPSHTKAGAKVISLARGLSSQGQATSNLVGKEGREEASLVAGPALVIIQTSGEAFATVRGLATGCWEMGGGG